MMPIESRRPLWFAILMVLCCAGKFVKAEPFAPSMLSVLLSEGASIGTQSYPLSVPQADPRLPRQELAEAQRSLAGSRGWSQFIRDSVVAPVHIDLEYLTQENGQRVGQRVHLAFVVHRDIKTLRDDNLIREMFASEMDSSEDDNSRSEPMDPKVLLDMGIEAGEGSSYHWLKTVLLNKILISGVLRSERVEGDDYFAIAWKLDERFTDHHPSHSKYRNEWIRLDRDDLGNAVQGESQPYSGAAGYVIVSPVTGVVGASLIESEIVLHEPSEWFSGSNLLRSKLPLILQEGARKMRRGLKPAKE